MKRENAVGDGGKRAVQDEEEVGRSKAGWAARSRGCVDAAIRFSAGGFVGFPVLVVGAVAAWRTPGLLWSVVVFGSAVLWSFAIQLALQAVAEVRNLREAGRFIQNFPGVVLRRISLEQLASGLFGSEHEDPVQRLLGSVDGEMPFGRAPGTFRVAVAGARSGKAVLPSTLLAFPTWDYVYVVLPVRPEDLTGLQRFMVLHELGHASREGMLIRMATLLTLGASVLAIPILGAFFIPWSVTGLVVMGLLTLTVLAAGVSYMRHIARKGWVWEEAHADLWALRRADPEWFGSFDASRVAARLTADTREAAPQVLEARTQALAKNIERVRVGQPPEVKEVAALTSFSQIAFSPIVIAVLLAAVTAASLSPVRALAAFGCGTVALLLAALAWYQVRMVGQHIMDPHRVDPTPELERLDKEHPDAFAKLGVRKDDSPDPKEAAEAVDELAATLKKLQMLRELRQKLPRGESDSSD